MMHCVFRQFDVLGLLESWLTFQGEFDYFLQDYACFDDVRTKRETAAVLTYL